MKKLIFLIPLFIIGGFFVRQFQIQQTISGAPPYLVVDEGPSEEQLDEYAYLNNWKRPEGPPRVGLQAGHWKNDELPEELKRLTGNTGATGGGKSEAEVNLAIAEHTKMLLEEKGIIVDILPTTVPIDYWADVFVSIHADGSLDTTKSGFKAAYPRRDLTGNAKTLVKEIETAYQEVTQLPLDPNVTRNMTGYYAFGWWRYDHAVHPMTTAAILETGFLTNFSDQQLLIKNPQKVASGLSRGIISYLEKVQLL